MGAPAALRRLEAEDPRWDAYVRSHPRGTFFHLLGWRRVIKRAYAKVDRYLYAERGDRICGVLPLFESGGAPFSKALVSVPVGVHGGIIADDAEAAELLRAGAKALAIREKVPFVEYKSEKAEFADLPTKRDLYFTFRQEIFGDREKQLNAIPRKTRAVLREAERAKLTADFNRTDLEPFMDLYALSLRNLGTPMFPRELFVASVEEFPKECDILSVRQCGQIIGCVLNYYYEGVMLPFFMGTLPAARDVGVNHYPYWVMLETGHSRGYKVFDFGRSKANTGPFKFKVHFGMEPIPLEYQYDLVSTQELPNLNPTNPRYEKAIEMWKQLPVGLTKRIGPMISRRLP